MGRVATYCMGLRDHVAKYVPPQPNTFNRSAVDFLGSFPKRCNLTVRAYVPPQPHTRHDTLDSNYSEFPNSSLRLDLGFGANYPEIPDSCIQAECLPSSEGCYGFRSSTRR